MKKRFLVFFVAFACQIGLVNADAASVNDWHSFGGNNANSKLNYSKTVTSKDDIQKKFVSGSFKEPIIVNDKVYIVDTKGKDWQGSATGKPDLVELSLDGKELNRIGLADSVGFFSRIAYGDGKIYVALSSRIQAIDIEKKESVWISEDTQQQMISSIIYYNGYIYSGTTSPKGAGPDASDGYFYAINVKDEDLSKTDEVKKFSWKWELEDKDTGFYWASPAIVNNAVVFVGDSGDIVSHHLTKDVVYDRYEIPIENGSSNKSRASVYYNEKLNTVYVGTQNSKKLVSIEMDKEKFKAGSQKTVAAPDEITGGVKGDGDKIFASSGGMGASGGIIHSDSSLGNVSALSDHGTQSMPMLTKAYATKDKDISYLYYLDYKTGVLGIAKKDETGKVTLEDEYFDTENMATYNSNSTIATKDGTLLVPSNKFPTGGGLLYLENKKAAFTSDEIANLLETLPANVEYSDRDKVEAISYQYNKYKEKNGAHDKENLMNSAITSLEKVKSTKISAAEAEINKTVTELSDDKAQKAKEIRTIRDADYYFNALSVEDQAKVSNQDKLKEALVVADSSEYGITPAAMVEQIDVLKAKDNDLGDLPKVYQLDDIYNSDKYTEEQQKEVTNYQDLVTIKTELEKIGNEVYETQEIIKDLPMNITLNDDANVQKAIKNYKGLSAENKVIANKGFKLKVDNKLTNVKVTEGDYKYLLECNNKLNKLKGVVVSGKNTYYYKLVDNKWFNYQRIYRNGKATTTYTYALDKAKLKEGDRRPGNGSRLTKSITKNGAKTTTHLYRVVNKANKVYKSSTITRYKGKNTVTYNRSIAYYGNGRIKTDAKYAKSYKTRKTTSKNKITYNGAGKKTRYVKFSYRSGKYKTRTEYVYNKAGQLKSNKYGKAYRYTTTYNKKGKATRTVRKQYKANGKFAKKTVKVKKRNFY
ncbi:MAG: hypothetical protein RR601_03165 [Erysipelotrichales bacterium]